MIQRLALTILAAAALSTPLAPTWAQGDARTGGWLARAWCGGCHGLATGTVSDSAPSLEEIGVRSQSRPDWVRSWLAAPHPPMPNFALSRTEIEDIVTYLGTLPTH